MEFLGWTLTNPAKTKNPKDFRVYAINNKGARFISVSIDAAMREIIAKGMEEIADVAIGGQYFRIRPVSAALIYLFTSAFQHIWAIENYWA